MECYRATLLPTGVRGWYAPARVVKAMTLLRVPVMPQLQTVWLVDVDEELP
jgi:hypothetical protein